MALAHHREECREKLPLITTASRARSCRTRNHQRVRLASLPRAALSLLLGISLGLLIGPVTASAQDGKYVIKRLPGRVKAATTPDASGQATARKHIGTPKYFDFKMTRDAASGKASGKRAKGHTSRSPSRKRSTRPRRSCSSPPGSIKAACWMETRWEAQRPAAPQPPVRRSIAAEPPPAGGCTDRERHDVSRAPPRQHRGEPSTKFELEQTEAAARTLGIRFQKLVASQPGELEQAFAAAAAEHAGGVIVFTHGFAELYRRNIIDAAARHRMPTMYGWRDFVAEGGLMSYGPNVLTMVRTAAS
jgi:hypothetical protein